MRFIILLIVVLVGAFIFFGKNPVKEMQKQAIEMRKKYGSDPLSQETNIFIEKRRIETGGGAVLRSNTVAPPDDGNLDSAKPPVDGMVVKGNSDGELPSAGKNLVRPQSGGYYPPIVGSSATDGGKKLRSGQPIAFDGTAVYSVDKMGRKTLLPDGTYTLYDGSSIEIHGGRRISTSY
jgi:hypothetical protein